MSMVKPNNPKLQQKYGAREYEKCMSMVIVWPSRGVTICNVRLPLSQPNSTPSTEKPILCVERSTIPRRPGGLIALI